ncbi:isochorismatase family protein [Aquirhabdus parva]|uniref:Isochorismatase family protein n=1 Tax=Aquirhabdus parva TaxID=2283318 RepID=A0A345P8Y5_9GAMM|nr:isochorismatase family protein [Aquirhabdus parva]AXI03744.1 isochorismatase family protein [Aquirhabdus parva]
MAFTQLDPKTALIVIDLQKGIVSLPVVHDPLDVIAKARAIAEQFRSHQLPVILVNVAGGAPGRADQMARGERPADWTDLVPELAAQPEDLRLTKRTWGAFSTDLNAHLKGLGVTQVVIVGIATSIGVESTARQAHELGYHVSIVTDAITDTNLDAHHNSITRIFPRISETGSTQDLITLLKERA